MDGWMNEWVRLHVLNCGTSTFLSGLAGHYFIPFSLSFPFLKMKINYAKGPSFLPPDPLSTLLNPALCQAGWPLWIASVSSFALWLPVNCQELAFGRHWQVISSGRRVGLDIYSCAFLPAGPWIGSGYMLWDERLYPSQIQMLKF